jgi:hypothetical protein
MAGGPIGGHGPNRVIEFAVDRKLIRADGIAPSAFTQGDWPNPVRAVSSFAAGLFVSLNLLTSTLSPVSVPFAQDDWPVPKGSARSVVLLTHTQNLLQTTLVSQDKFYGVPGQVPVYDWQNPRGAKGSIGLWTFTDSFKLNLQVIAPFTQDDWPNPRSANRPVDLLSYIDSSETWLLKDQFYGAAGQVPTYDWQNPRSAKPSIDLSTYIDPSETWLLKDQFFGAAGQPPANLDWPVPRGAKGAVSLATFIDPFKLTLQGQDKFFSDAGQGPAYDYPNPRGRAGNTHQYDAPNLIILYTVPVAQMPFNQEDWPNPRGQRGVIDLLSYIDPSEVWMFRDTFFGVPGQVLAYDWQNPRWRASIAHLFDHKNPGLFVAVQSPFAQLNWQNPLVAGRGVDLLSYIDPSEVWMLRDIFFGAAGQPPANLDWQNPRGKPFSIDLGSFIDASEFWMLRDVMFGVAGQVPAYDWQNPRGRIQPALSWIQQTPSFSTIVLPFRQIDWVNPKGRQHFEIKSAFLDSFYIQQLNLGITGSTDRTYIVTPQGRIYIVDAQNRVRLIDPENRVLMMEAQNRILALVAENRVLLAELQRRGFIV